MKLQEVKGIYKKKFSMLKKTATGNWKLHCENRLEESAMKFQKTIKRFKISTKRVNIP